MKRPNPFFPLIALRPLLAPDIHPEIVFSLSLVNTSSSQSSAGRPRFDNDCDEGQGDNCDAPEFCYETAHTTPEAFSEELRPLEMERTEQPEKIDERSVSGFEPAGIAAILRSHGFSAIEDINSRRSRPDLAAPFKDSRPDTLAFMLSTLNAN